MARIIQNGLCGLTVTLAFTFNTHASDKTFLLPTKDSVQSVEVILTADGLKTAIPMTEDLLQKHYCSFSTKSREKINDLFSIISEYGQKSDHSDPIKLRHAIYFTLDGGKKEKILLSDNRNLDYFIKGSLTAGTSTTQIKFSDGFLPSLRNWASSDVAKRNFYEFCLISEPIKKGQ